MEKQNSMKLGEEKCKYTLIPIENQEHREKLDKFITTRGKIRLKGSLCRFYLRGICIMKPEYCKFAHSVKELNISTEEGLFYMTLSDKQRRKRQFTEKRQFNQTALFILKNVKYQVLYDYQFSQRFLKSGLKAHDVETIGKDRAVRIRIRQIMHREIWDDFLEFLETRFPHTNFPISFLSFWYANFGFDKPQTRCKFGDFLKYVVVVRNYKQIDVVFPPNQISSIYLVNCRFKQTILEQNVDFLYEQCMKQKQKQSKQKIEEFLQRALPQQLSKKYICRYFMAGNCQQSSEKCLYAHSIEELSENYQIDQQFPVQYRQPVIPLQVRLNFTSLYEATRKYQQYSQYLLEDINLNSTIRYELRDKVHFELFGDFMKLLEELLEHTYKNKKENEENFFSIQLRLLQKYYQGAGFNHTNQNKFQHLEGSLWNLGYYTEDVVIKDQQTLQKRKCSFVYKIPPLQYLDKKFRKLIQDCVASQIQALSENGILLQSALRRKIYKEQSTIPLHVYLRYKRRSLQSIIQQFCVKQQVERIFFESGQQNAKKISQFVRKFIKKNKKYILKLDQIEYFIKEEKKNQVNLNHHFINLRTLIQNTVVEMGKILYYWPFDNNFFVIDLNHLSNYKKNVVEPLVKSMNKDESLQNFKIKCTNQQIQSYINERIIVVDSLKTLHYSKKYLQDCRTLGVDLQGRLRMNGFVDLIQIAGVKRNEKGDIEHKQIFIFDIWAMSGKVSRKQLTQDNQTTELTEQSKNQKEDKKAKLYKQQFSEAINLIKRLFENEKKIKILHDCRQDSVALKYILGITLKSVFDTSGFDVYVSQKNIYEDKTHNINLIKKIHDVKVPGLNTILDTYKAPNGINIFKESMKKIFGDPNSRPYFEQRPIDEQFLEYSARDVEDLIQVYENMMELDTQSLAHFIGELYSTC